MDIGSYVYIYVGSKVQPTILNHLFGTDNFVEIDEEASFLY